MTLRAISATACAVALLAGCASGARSIAPVAISASEYAGLSCDQMRAQLSAARTREMSLTNQQNSAAMMDAAGVFLVLVPLGSISGQNVSGELAQAKGEVIALTRAHAQRCEGATVTAPAVPATPAPAPNAAPVEEAVQATTPN